MNMNHANMNDCPIIRDRLSAYMDGELNSEVVAEVREHLCRCTACSAELDEFQELAKMIGIVEGNAASSAAVSGLPAWEVIAKRLDGIDTSPAAGLDGCSPNVKRSMPRLLQHWKAVSGTLAALAASLLLIASLWQPANEHPSATGQTTVASLNLQPVLENFEEKSESALDHLASQFVTKDVPLDRVDAGFGRQTFVSLASHQQSLPGDAKVSATKVMSFSFCKCPDGECSCGPDGCSCVACVCERPDGSSYLVFEHCKSQSVSFGDLPVQLVNRDGKEYQRVVVDGTETISFEGPSGRITAVGLRGEAEVNTLLASR